jgi:hypothetical protein
MSSEMKKMLQSIIDSIENPAFIEDSGKIIFTNKEFEIKGFNKNFRCEKICEYELKEKDIYNNLKICEIVDADIQKLNESKQKLLQAMALL